MIKNVRTFDLNEIDNHLEVVNLLYKANKDVITRFVFKELGQSSITGSLFEDRYHRRLMRQTDVYYTDIVQPYNIVSDQSDELSHLPLLHLVDTKEKLKKLLLAVTDEEKPTTKFLGLFEKDGRMPTERFPYLVQVCQAFTFARLFEIFRIERALLKVEKAMTEQDDVVNNETKTYYSDCRLWLNRSRSKIIHHQVMVNARYSGREYGDSRQRFLQEQENRSLFYNMVNFRKEIRVSNCVTRGRTNYETWVRGQLAPSDGFNQLNYLPKTNLDLFHRLSQKTKGLTGFRMTMGKRRTDFSAYRSNSFRQKHFNCRNQSNYTYQDGQQNGMTSKNKGPMSPSNGGNRT